MKITLVMVSSLNGRITKGNNPDIYRWTSKEDQKFFFSLIHKSKLIVMGSKTYEAVRSFVLPKDPDRKTKLRVILTRHPQKYAKESRPGHPVSPSQGGLEFTSVKPKQLVNQLAKRGYKELLLVGGGEANKTFLEAGLVNELLITIEPKIFGTGKLMIGEGAFNKNLKLVSVKKLNKQGTLLCKYTL